jgi:hypothetical protein
MTPMRRYIPLLIAGSAFIAAACSDTIAPTRSTTVKDLPTLTAFRGGSSSYALSADDNSEGQAETITFKLKAKGGRARVHGLTIDYPANAVCDPSVSSYGPTEWDTPCTTLTKGITVTAKFWTENGRTQADFSPDIRFDPSKDVYISTYMPALRGQPDNDDTRAKFSIWYSRRDGDTRYFIDDAANDPRLATHFNLRNGKASRKIQHFSGYFVQWGSIWCEDGSDSIDPACLTEQIF